MKLSKSHKWTIGLVSVILIALLIWWLLRKKKPQVESKPLDPTPKKEPASSTSPEETNNPSDDAVMLRKGSKGEPVKVLQRYLNQTLQAQYKEYKVELLEVDGIFGAETEGYLDILHQTKVVSFGQYRTIVNKLK